MSNERTHIVTYDISNAQRWRRLFKTMHGYGDWLQLSVFQCRLSSRRRAELETELREVVKAGEDHVLMIDVGQADKTDICRREHRQVLFRNRASGPSLCNMSRDDHVGMTASPYLAAETFRAMECFASNPRQSNIANEIDFLVFSEEVRDEQSA